MKKFVVVDELKNGDVFLSPMFDTYEDAFKCGSFEFEHLTKYDIKGRKSFYVGIFDSSDDTFDHDIAYYFI